MSQEKKLETVSAQETEVVSKKEKSKKTKEWIVTPSFIWNIMELKPITGNRGQIVTVKLRRFVKHLFIALGKSVLFLMLSGLLAVVFSFIIAEFEWMGYCFILTLSFLAIYLDENSALKEEIKLRSYVQNQLIRICDIYNIHNQYSGDVKKGWLGSEMPGLSMLAFFPYRVSLLTAYAIIIIVEQLSDAGCPLGWFNQLSENISGIKYVAVAFLAIDEVMKSLKAEKERVSQEFDSQERPTQLAYEPIFLKSHFYLLDSYMTELTTGQILIAKIDKQSMAYHAGVREYDIITSINGLASKITTLQLELTKWREGNTSFVLELVTDESNYQESLKITFRC